MMCSKFDCSCVCDNIQVYSISSIATYRSTPPPPLLHTGLLHLLHCYIQVYSISSIATYRSTPSPPLLHTGLLHLLHCYIQVYSISSIATYRSTPSPPINVSPVHIGPVEKMHIPTVAVSCIHILCTFLTWNVHNTKLCNVIDPHPG